MRPFVKVAVTLIACVGVFVAYRVYMARIDGKKARTLNRKKKGVLNKKSEEVKSSISIVSSDEETPKVVAVPLTMTGSDILHPEPYDNVNGGIKSEYKKDNQLTAPENKSNKDSNSSANENSGKLEIPNFENGGDDIKTAITVKGLSNESMKADEKDKVSPEGSTETTHHADQKAHDCSKRDVVSLKVVETPKEGSTTDQSVQNNVFDSGTTVDNSKMGSVKPPVIENISTDEHLKSYRNRESTNTSTTSPDCSVISVKSPLPPLNVVENNASLPPALPSSMIEEGSAKFKMCRCRALNRNEALVDEKVPQFHKQVKPNVPPTIVIPVSFSHYKPTNLLEQSGDLTELPSLFFEKTPEKEDTYLSGLNPIFHASYAAHYHSCLINQLIDNYDFFE